MRPLFHPRLINEAFGDPGLYVEFMFERRALLFDMGDLHALAPRKILKVTHAFVSHTHMDHFVGFDQLLRICLGRPVHLEVFGPPGIIGQIAHRLAAYTWNLIQNNDDTVRIRVGEVHPAGRVVVAEFDSDARFERRDLGERTVSDGVLVEEDAFRVRAALLDHKIPCLAFSLEERAHVNVWKTKLDEMGFATGPWLAELKRAVLRGDADDGLFRVWWKSGDGVQERMVPLGTLKQRLLNVGPGQKVAYVVDAAYHEENAGAIVDLAHHADVLFIEAAFLDRDAERAADRAHLTARQAGLLARRAGVKSVEPFHFSPRYTGQEDALRDEVVKGFIE